MTDDLAYFSLVAVYSAMAIYTISFVAFALDLAKRSGDAQHAATAAIAPRPQGRGAGRRGRRSRLRPAAVSGGSTIVLDRDGRRAAGGRRRTLPAASGRRPSTSRSSFERVATAMMVLGLLVHVVRSSCSAASPPVGCRGPTCSSSRSRAPRSSSASSWSSGALRRPVVPRRLRHGPRTSSCSPSAASTTTSTSCRCSRRSSRPGS